jgi:cholesterol oxidase
MSSTVRTSKAPTSFIPESILLAKAYSKAINGVSTSFFVLETLAKVPSTAQILDGTVVGKDSAKHYCSTSFNILIKNP